MEEKITFEEALARLEELVRSLEEGKLPLAESLAAFEEEWPFCADAPKNLKKLRAR